jgi:hypothetical protein
MLSCHLVNFRRFIGAFAILSILSCLAETQAAAPDETGYTRGIPWTGTPGIRQQTSEIMARQQQQQTGRSRSAWIHPRGRFGPDGRPEKMDTVEVPIRLDSAPAGGLPDPGSPQLPSINFTGATLADTLAYPPDSMGAVGPSQFIVAVNGRIRTFDKNTGAADGVINVDTDVFFNPVMTPPVANNFTSDPRIRYDRLSRRWFITMLDVPGRLGSLPNRIMVAASDGPVITSLSSWTLFYFRQDQVAPAGDTGEFADYPTVGIDANALYIGVNIFGTRGQGSFDNTTLFVVRKSTLLVTNNAPTNIVVTAFRGLVPNGTSGGPFTPQGVDNYDPSATEGYAIGVAGTSKFLIFGELVLRRISNPGGTPSISPNIYIVLPSTAMNGGTINVPHLGNTGGAAGNLDGLDYRLMSAHIRNGQLWTSANLAVDNTGAPGGTDTRMGVRWWELNGIATGQTPGIVQSGVVFQPSASNTTDQRCYWMGTVMVSGQGHVAMGFSVAGALEHVNAGTVGRLVNDPPGTMRTPVLYTASAAAYNPLDINNNPINRWGDYSYTSLDPGDDMTMWTIQEFCNATDSYGVQVLKLLAPAPATPSTCNPASAAAGAVNLNIIVTGITNGDTGFFDPGAGFSNRISAVVNGGGVTVNSVTYNNPTNITLNVNVAPGAAAGSRTITVTNPDGQSATSLAGILTVTSGATNNPPVLTAISDKIVNEGSALVFTNSATDPNGDSLTFSLDPGSPAGAGVNPATGVFSWTPTEAQGPATNSITVRVTDNGSPPLSATKTFSVVVNEVNQAPVLAAISNRTVYAGMTLTITNSATDADIPANTLTYSLDPGAPAGAAIDPVTGVFTWQPPGALANTTTNITVRVTDNGSPPLHDTKSFAVTVAPAPVIQEISLSNNFVTITWTAIAGQTYRLEYRTDLIGNGWTNLPPDVTATGPTASKSDSILSSTQKFYRVFVVP